MGAVVICVAVALLVVCEYVLYILPNCVIIDCMIVVACCLGRKI